MYRYLVATLLIPWITPSLVHAQKTIQSIIWKTPDGDLPDLSQTFTSGTTLGLSWNEYNSTQYVDTTNNLVYLWVTAFDYNTNPFRALLKKDINLTVSGNFAWTINIPEQFLAVSAKYVLRFKVAELDYDLNDGELSSPGFLVLRPADRSTSSFQTSSSTTSTSLGALTTATNILQASSTPTSTSNLPQISPISTNPPALSSGAKAGIAIGALAVAAALVSAGWFVLFRRPKRSDPSNGAPRPLEMYQPEHDKAQQPVHYPPTPLNELPSGWEHDTSDLSRRLS